MKIRSLLSSVLVLVLALATAPFALADEHEGDVFGVVTDAATGEGIEGATVTLLFVEPPPGGVGSTVTDAEGAYAFTDVTPQPDGHEPEAPFIVIAEADGYDSASSANFSYDGTAPVEVDLVLPPQDGTPRVSVTVTDAASGAPIDEGFVALHYADGDSVPAQATDSDGVLRIWNVREGVDFRFSVAAEGYVELESRVYRDEGEEPLDVELALAPLGDPLWEVAGSTRYETAIEASRRGFANGADAVVVATGANWPDALGGAALAGVLEGPQLLTPPGGLSEAVADEIERLGAGEAYLLGGTAAVSETVEGALGELLGAANVHRVAGDDRVATADAVAEIVIDHQGDDFTGDAFVATSRNFPDALAASPLAAASGMPILLASPDTVPDLPDAVSDAVILGGTGAVSTGTQDGLEAALGADAVERLGGANRYATAALVADHAAGAGLAWDYVGVATGEDFPDALAGGAMLASFGSVLLLAQGEALPPEAVQHLADHSNTIRTVHVLGGQSALGADVRSAILDALDGA